MGINLLTYGFVLWNIYLCILIFFRSFPKILNSAQRKLYVDHDTSLFPECLKLHEYVVAMTLPYNTMIRERDEAIRTGDAKNVTVSGEKLYDILPNAKSGSLI